MVNCLRRFIPDLSQNLTHMEIKAILKGPVGLSAFEPGWDIALYVDFSGIGMGLALTQGSGADMDKKKIIYCEMGSLQ